MNSTIEGYRISFDEIAHKNKKPIELLSGNKKDLEIMKKFRN